MRVLYTSTNEGKVIELDLDKLTLCGTKGQIWVEHRDKENSNWIPAHCFQIIPDRNMDPRLIEILSDITNKAEKVGRILFVSKEAEYSMGSFNTNWGDNYFFFPEETYETHYKNIDMDTKFYRTISYEFLKNALIDTDVTVFELICSFDLDYELLVNGMPVRAFEEYKDSELEEIIRLFSSDSWAQAMGE